MAMKTQTKHAALKVRKGDTVKVIAGKDRGKEAASSALSLRPTA